MATPDIAAAKSKLQGFLQELEAKRSNPFADSPLEQLRDEIRKLRTTYGLSYEQISTKLSSFGISTSEGEIRRYCGLILGKKRRPPSPKKRSVPAN